MGSVTDAFDGAVAATGERPVMQGYGAAPTASPTDAFDAAARVGANTRSYEYIDDSANPNAAPGIGPRVEISGTSRSTPSAFTGIGSTAAGASVLGAAKGAFDTLVDGPAQTLANAAADAYPKHWPAWQYLQDQKQIANQGVTERAANFADETRDHPTAATVGETAGGIGGALALPLGAVGEGVNLVNKLIYAAKTGAAVGSTKPLEDASNFWASKAREAAGGAIGGVVGYPIGAAVGKAVGYAGDKVANAIRPIANKFRGAESDASAAVADSSPELQAAVTGAMNRGEKIDSEALARHVQADSLPVKMTLTPGQATQDPLLISQEQNMRGANPALGYRFNDQNAQLVQNVDVMRKNFAPDAASTNHYEASQHLIDAIQGKVDATKANVSTLYKRLSDANGGALPLDGQTFAIKANEALGGLTGKAEFLPSPIQSILNNLQTAKGNMDYSNFEALRTILATEARSNANGNAVAAVNTVRKVLEDMPMTSEAAEVKPLADAARTAAKAHFDMMRDAPAYKAVANGSAEPDTFAKKFILGAPTSHVSGLANVLGDHPEALQEMKAVGMHYLKDSAVNHAGQFSQSAYNDALGKLSPKLPVLYGPQEAAQLQALGNVATHVQARPAGHFVNTSNTETANLARGAGDMAGMAVNAATHSPVGSIVNNALQSSFEKKVAASKLSATLGPGAGIASPGSTSDLLKSRFPALTGQIGMIPIASILSDFATNKGQGKPRGGQ